MRLSAARRCLSCGDVLIGRRRKYCSVDCRQRLRRRLDQRTGLLVALNARYASFYFTQRVVVLDVVIGEETAVHSFMYPRSAGLVPAEDFSRMADSLGRLWWDARRRTRRRYLASRSVLAEAVRKRNGRSAVVPLMVCQASVRQGALTCLNIDRESLAGPDLEGRIKRAFRHRAMQCHPDTGGDGEGFRRLRRAYEELLEWAEAPSFILRRGFADKWFYDARRNAWVQPLPGGQAKF
ncbi:MAG: J domain-containing protein [Deltaproteobacteria bacterium]|nr:MAG: J domain-containing protein [Deltaproteobacteria bacterium]